MSQLGEFIATIQNNQDVRTAELEERLATLEGKDECGCAETITALEARLATLESKGECGCGSYDELLASYEERISDLEGNTGGSNDTQETTDPATVVFTKTGFIPNSQYEENKTAHAYVSNAKKGATYTIEGTAETFNPITVAHETRVEWHFTVELQGATVSVYEEHNGDIRLIGISSINISTSDLVIEDAIGVNPIGPICSGGGIGCAVQSINPENPGSITRWSTTTTSTPIEPRAINLTSEPYPLSLCLLNPLKSGELTVVGYDIYGNRSNEVSYNVLVDSMEILLLKKQDSDSVVFTFAITNCEQKGGRIDLEQKQSDGTWSTIYSLEVQNAGAQEGHLLATYGEKVTIPVSTYELGEIRAHVENTSTGCVYENINLSNEFTRKLLS